MRKSLLLILTFVLFGCSQVDAPTPLSPLNTQDNLRFSASPNMSNPKALEGATVSGDIYVWYEPDTSIQQVRFYLDDNWVDRRTERYAPYALSGDRYGKLRALDTSTLSPGRHKVVARVKLRNGSFKKWQAHFTVKREPGAPEDPVALKPGEILWRADHEEGNLSDWYAKRGGGEFNSGGGRSSVSRDVAKSGRYAAKMVLTDVDKTEGVRLFRWDEPRREGELYYSTWYYFPKRHNAPNWWNVWQFKSKTSSRNDPFFLIDIANRKGGNMHFRLYDWQERRSYHQSLKDIPVGRWFHVEVFYKSRGDRTGAITVWQDGTKIFDVKNVRTRYADGDTQWSVNNYTASIKPDPVVTYVDDALISKARVGPQTQATVEANR